MHVLVRAPDDLTAVRGAIAAQLGRKHSLRILSTAELVEWYASQVRQAFAGLYVLAGLILLVVLCGIADTLAAGVLEQRRELATVRAAGVRARHLRHIVLIEALLLGGLGLALATAIGFALGVFWVQATIPSLLGWILQLRIPYGHIAVMAALSIVVCALAALLPAVRAAHSSPPSRCATSSR